MIKDQILAWRSLSQNDTLSLNVRDENGNKKDIKVKLDIAVFSFGVNEVALNMTAPKEIFNKLSKNVDSKLVKNTNKENLKKLFGDKFLEHGSLGGWVKEYLLKNPNAQNKEYVNNISHQIREIWNKKQYNEDGGEPYKMVKRIAVLTNELDAVACWNCKSGKDRTGMLDAEIKHEVINHHQGYSLSAVAAKRSASENKLFSEVLKHGGNLEVQEKNTGVAGNKVIKALPAILKSMALSYNKNIDNKSVWLQVKGLSSLV